MIRNPGLRCSGSRGGLDPACILSVRFLEPLQQILDMKPCRDIDYVLYKLNWMREEGIWPNGLRYLWTDAFGVVLLASLAAELDE